MRRERGRCECVRGKKVLGMAPPVARKATPDPATITSHSLKRKASCNSNFRCVKHVKREHVVTPFHVLFQSTDSLPLAKLFSH